MGTRETRPTGWGSAVAAYVTTMQAAGRRPGTIRLHRHYLGQLVDELGRVGPWQVTTGQLERFLSRPAWKPETRKSARSVVVGFYRWAHGRGWVEVDPAVGLPAVRVPLTTGRPTPEHLVARLVRENSRIGYMAMLAAYGGLRAAEIAQVLPERDLIGDVLTVHGKGGKERYVPIVHGRLLAQLRVDAHRGGYAFPNGLGGHLSPGRVSKLLSEALPAGWTGHTLRHRMATTSYAGTRDLLAVSQVLGHARVDTTQRYIRLPDDALRAAVAAAAV